MGGFELLGEEGRPNIKKAFELLKASAESNCKEGMRELGYVYEKGGMQEGKNGPFVKLADIDLDRAHSLYLKAVDMDDNLARNLLGSYYFNHTREFDKAVKLFRLACEKKGNNERALNNLGVCFEQGVGDAVQDYQQAMKLYEESADLGYDQAMVNLAYLYFKLASNGAAPFTHQG